MVHSSDKFSDETELPPEQAPPVYGSKCFAAKRREKNAKGVNKELEKLRNPEDAPWSIERQLKKLVNHGSDCFHSLEEVLVNVII